MAVELVKSPFLLSSRPQLHHVKFMAFEEATRAVIQRWTALNLAVSNNWGDGDSLAKREALVQQVLPSYDMKYRLVP
jgi:hypothetical protein